MTRIGWLGAPLVAYLVLLLVYPSAHALRLACTDTATGVFPTLDNFRALAGDELFWRALVGNAVLPLVVVALEVAAGLALALALATRVPARRLLRTIVVVPFAVPEIVFLSIVRQILAPHGYANGALTTLGLPAIDWLVPGTTAAYASVVLVDAWRTTPIVFLLLLAALSAIPESVDEAARIDGATGARRLRHVTVPLLAPALAAAILLRGLDALRIFATPLVLTGAEGVPVLSTYAYQQWSDAGDDGAAAAAAMVLALICVAVSAPLLRRAGRVEGAAT